MFNVKDISTRRTITSSDGEKIVYRTVGTPSNKAVVILHGHSMESRMCLPPAVAFSDTHYFILPDMRGFGQSSPYISDTDDVLSVLAEDVERILLANKVEEVKLVGISVGTMVALQILRRSQVDISRLLIVDHSCKPISTPGRKTGFCPEAQETGSISKMVDLFKQEIGYFKQGRWLYRRDANFENMSSKFKKEFALASTATMLSAISPVPSKLLSLASNRFLRKLNPMYRSWYTTLLILSSYIERNYDFIRDLADTEVPYDIYWGKETKMFGPDALKDYENIQSMNSGEIVMFEGGHDFFITEFPNFMKEFKKFLDK